MSKQLLKQLINFSFVNNKLDENIVKKISTLLNRSQLKLYLKSLRKKEEKLSVFVDIAIKSENTEKKFKNIFPNRKILLRIDPELLLGARITDDDNVFELSLKNTLDKITSYIEKYD